MDAQICEFPVYFVYLELQFLAGVNIRHFLPPFEMCLKFTINCYVKFLFVLAPNFGNIGLWRNIAIYIVPRCTKMVYTKNPFMQNFGVGKKQLGEIFAQKFFVKVGTIGNEILKNFTGVPVFVFAVGVFKVGVYFVDVVTKDVTIIAPMHGGIIVNSVRMFFHSVHSFSLSF